MNENVKMGANRHLEIDIAAVVYKQETNVKCLKCSVCFLNTRLFCQPRCSVKNKVSKDTAHNKLLLGFKYCVLITILNTW